MTGMLLNMEGVNCSFQFELDSKISEKPQKRK